jgi:hypothetical protein
MTNPSRLLQILFRAWTFSRGTARGKIAIALVLGGIPIVGQGWVKLVVSAAWEATFGKPINFPDTSPLWGSLLIALGLGFFAWTAPSERRARTVTRRTVIAIRHQSMEALTRSLLPSALPAGLADADISHFEINQGAFYAEGTLKSPEAAVSLQRDLVPQLRALLSSAPDAELVYYGKAHIPLVFLAGHAVSTGASIRLYELDRESNGWRMVEEGEGEDLGLGVERAAGSESSHTAVVRVSISYPIHAADVDEVVQRPYRDVHLSIAEPRIDAIRTTRQIEQITRTFRRTLDQVKSELPGRSDIHVFYSGPMSLAFSLGRQISATIHPPVFVHNFSARTTPRYSWALHINGDASPGSLIVPVSVAISGRS